MIKIRKSEMHIASLQKTLIQDNGIKKTNVQKRMLSPFLVNCSFFGGFTKAGT